MKSLTGKLTLVRLDLPLDLWSLAAEGTQESERSEFAMRKERITMNYGSNSTDG